MAFRSVPYDSLSLNPFTKIGKEWALLTAGDENGFNTMTVSWGAMGFMWGKPSVTVYIRPQDVYKRQVVARLHFDAQEAAVNAFGVALFIVHAGHVAAAVRDDRRDLLELTGLVDKLDEEARGTAGVHQAAVNHAGKARHVDVAAGDDAHNALAL